MSSNCRKILNSIVEEYDGEKVSQKFRVWFLKWFENQTNCTCSLEEFAVYFLNVLRQQTFRHLQVNSGTDTPKCQTPVKTLKANLTQDEPVSTMTFSSQSQQRETSTPNHSLKNDTLQISYGDWAGSQSMARLSTSADRSENSQKNVSSTPVRRNVSGHSKRQSLTPGSANKSSSTNLCLGDFLVFNTPTSHNRSHKKKNTSASSLNQSQTSAHQQNEKPKKRVQPISIKKNHGSSGGNNSVFAGESSFSNENNILQISHNEVEDKEQCAILAARKILKSNASEITKELEESSKMAEVVVADTSTVSKQQNASFIEEPPIDLENLKKLKNSKILHTLANIYVVLIDMNLTTNFLNELSFLLNLLNASSSSASILPSHTSQTTIAEDIKTLDLQDIEKCPNSLECLMDLSHAVYFALICLNQQKLRLASLDTITLKVVISTERFSFLNDEVRECLLESYQKKQQFLSENTMHDASICFENNPFNNVYFQQDQDTRQHFTSNQEFSNFRWQRDMFCKCLKVWETNHLNPNWKFSAEVAPKIREIFQLSEHCVNMAHFATLFVSQLLVSASNASSPEEIGLDVDLQKFSKLTQRLIAPSQFSVDYQFPRSQAFFRDFILESRSLPFTEQLKMELFNELISLNDFSFDHININKAENEMDNHDSLIAEFANDDQLVVRPDVLNSMLILAKFLGYTISLPFANNTGIPIVEEKKQMRLRTLMHPKLNLDIVLKNALNHGKLLITIPWIVQYISMLDNITLQLEVHTNVLNLLFALYWYLGDGNDSSTILHTSSCFIITACLGWLFDSTQFLIEQYYHFRSESALHPDLLFIKSKLEKSENETGHRRLSLSPLLEAILPVACPFLGEFRVSIMPAKYAQTKYASRSGRYRHITTRVADFPSTPQVKEGENFVNSPLHSKSTQKNLLQAFRHSLNSSTRQIISICTERCYKCVVKDAQLQILLPAKTKADIRVNDIESSVFEIVFNEIQSIYSQAHKEAKTTWNETVPKMIDRRIKNSLESLLPEETPVILKKTYFMIIKKDAQHKICQWFYGNVIRDNYFCVALDVMAKKLCSTYRNKERSKLEILKETPSVSELLYTFQYWLHCTSVRTELFKDSKPIVDLMQTLIISFDNVLPISMYRLIALNVIQLLQNIIMTNFTHLTPELIEASCRVWSHPNMQRALEQSNSSTTENREESTAMHNVYDALVTVPFIQTLGCITECYTKFGLLIIAMIEKQIISLNYANDLFVHIFKYEWHPIQLNEISNMLRIISQKTMSIATKSRASGNDDQNDDEEDDEKSNLFMDMLADLSRDVDFF